MSTVINTTKEVIRSFVDPAKLFTDLDISDKVKATLPYVRHREVKVLMKTLFQTEIEPFAYIISDIEVILADGTIAATILYHPVGTRPKEYHIPRKVNKSVVALDDLGDMPPAGRPTGKFISPPYKKQSIFSIIKSFFTYPSIIK